MKEQHTHGRHPLGRELGPVLDAVFGAAFGGGESHSPDEGRGPRGRGGRGDHGGHGGRGGRDGESRRGFGPRGGFPGGPRGRRGGPELPDATDAAGWFAGRLPDGWFAGAPEVTVDRDEILVVGELPPLEQQTDSTEEKADRAATAAAESGRTSRFREQTREERIEIARQAEHRYGRQVSWGARIGDTEELFTTLSAPVMTRLRQEERQVLDTLVAAGVARSRSDALAWAVRLVGQHADDWLSSLREAMEEVDRLRTDGPGLDDQSDDADQTN